MQSFPRLRLFWCCISVVLAATPAVARVWIFQTHLTGAMNQRLGLAHKLSPDVDILPAIAEHEIVDAEKYVRTFLGERFNNSEAWPDFILNTEQWATEVDLMMDIRKLSPKTTRVIHLENPNHRNNEFDLIVNSTHFPLLSGTNMIRPTGVASWVTSEKLSAAQQQWQSRLAWMKRPLILVAVGGNSHNNVYHPEFGHDLGQRLKSAASIAGGSLLITTSRRTPDPAIEALLFELSGVPHYLFHWNRDAEDANPYLAGLALADFVVATGDSLSMMSDVIATGKPLYIHAPLGSLLPAHPRMIEDLYVSGRARPFVGDELKKWTYEPYSVADVITHEIRQRFSCSGLLEPETKGAYRTDAGAPAGVDLGANVFMR